MEGLPGQQSRRDGRPCEPLGGNQEPCDGCDVASEPSFRATRETLAWLPGALPAVP